MRRMLAALIVFFAGASRTCQSQTIAIPDFDPHQKMVFVEDCDGEGGLLDFNFGDIVIFDPMTKQKTRLTRDRFYDQHPSWSSDGQKIIFESIRMDTPGTTGRYRIIDLSDPTHLFILEIKTGELTQFDKNFAKTYEDIVGEENRKPAWSPTSNQVAFVTRIEGAREKLVVLDLDTGMITSLSTPGQYVFSHSLVWSPTGQYIAFDVYEPRSGPKQGVVVMNVESKESKLFSETKRSCTLLGWTRGSVSLMLSYYEPTTKKESFYGYSYQTGKTIFLREYSSLVCNNSRFYPQDSEIAFIISDRSNYSNEVCIYNILDGSCARLTTDGHQKDGLMWYLKQ